MRVSRFDNQDFPYLNMGNYGRSAFCSSTAPAARTTTRTARPQLTEVNVKKEEADYDIEIL